MNSPETVSDVAREHVQYRNTESLSLDLKNHVVFIWFMSSFQQAPVRARCSSYHSPPFTVWWVQTRFKHIYIHMYTYIYIYTIDLHRFISLCIIRYIQTWCVIFICFLYVFFRMNAIDPRCLTCFEGRPQPVAPQMAAANRPAPPRQSYAQPGNPSFFHVFSNKKIVHHHLYLDILWNLLWYIWYVPCCICWCGKWMMDVHSKCF